MAFTVVFTAELAVTAYAHWFRRGPAPAAGSRAWLPLRLGRFVPFGSSIRAFRLVDSCLSARRFVSFAPAVDPGRLCDLAARARRFVPFASIRAFRPRGQVSGSHTRDRKAARARRFVPFALRTPLSPMRRAYVRERRA